MKKTKWIAGLLSFMMILSSLCVLPVTASAAEVGDTATEAQLMDGVMADPAVLIDFDAGYTGISDPNKADLQTDADGTTYLHQIAQGAFEVKNTDGTSISRPVGSLTKIKFRFAHHTEKAKNDDMIIFDGAMADGYRARFALMQSTEGMQQFFVAAKSGWFAIDLPENGQLAPNTWHELALQYDMAHNLTIWARVNCTGDYVKLMSYELGTGGPGKVLQMYYSGSKTGDNSILDVDYVKVHNNPEPVTTEKLLEGMNLAVDKTFQGAADLLGGTISAVAGQSVQITENGLTLTATSAEANWTFADGSVNMSDSAAIYTKFTETTGTGALNFFEVWGDGYRRRFGFTNSSFIYANGDGEWPKLNCTARAKDTPVELIVRTAVNNSLEFWVKNNTTGVWEYLTTTDGLPANSTARSARIAAAAGANLNVEFFRIYREPEKRETLEEVLSSIGQNHALAEYVDFEEGYNGKSYQGADIDGSFGFTPDYAVLDTDGNMQIKNNQNASQWTRNGFSPLANVGDAMEIRAKWKLGSVMTVELGAKTDTRAFMKIGYTGNLEFWQDGSFVNYNIADFSDKWVTYLITREGENSLGLRWRTDGEAKYSGIKAETASLRSGGANGIRFINEGYTAVPNGNDVYIDYYKVYKSGIGMTDAQAKPAAAQRLLFDEEFEAGGDGLTNKYVKEDVNSQARRSITADGTLKLDYKAALEEGQEAPNYENNFAIYNVKNASIPAGGYAEVRYKTSDDLGFSFFNEDNQLSWRARNGRNKSKYHNGTEWVDADVFANEANQWQTLRIVRSADGQTYDIYIQKADDDAWTLVGQNIPKRGYTGGDPHFNVEKYGGSTDVSGEVDYVKIYGPADSPLVLTDGAAVSWTPTANQTLFANEIRAIVAPAAAEQKLIFAAYDAEDGLVDVSLKPIAASASDTTEIYTVPTGKNAAKVKVFLWDGFENIKPVVGCDGAFSVK